MVSDADQQLVEYCEELALTLRDIWEFANTPWAPIDHVEMIVDEILQCSDVQASIALQSSHPLIRETYSWLVLFPDLFETAIIRIRHRKQDLETHEIEEILIEYGLKRVYDSCYQPLIRLLGQMKAEIGTWGFEHGKEPLTRRASLVDEIIMDWNKNGKAITGPQILDVLDQSERDEISPLTLNNLTGRIVLELKRKRGLKNAPRIGYYYPGRYTLREGDNLGEA